MGSTSSFFFFEVVSSRATELWTVDLSGLLRSGDEYLLCLLRSDSLSSHLSWCLSRPLSTLLKKKKNKNKPLNTQGVVKGFHVLFFKRSVLLLIKKRFDTFLLKFCHHSIPFLNIPDHICCHQSIFSFWEMETCHGLYPYSQPNTQNF